MITAKFRRICISSLQKFSIFFFTFSGRQKKNTKTFSFTIQSYHCILCAWHKKSENSKYLSVYLKINKRNKIMYSESQWEIRKLHSHFLNKKQTSVCHEMPKHLNAQKICVCVFVWRHLFKMLYTIICGWALIDRMSL